MLPRERVLRSLDHERPDRIPYEFELTPHLTDILREKTGMGDPAEHFDFDMRSVDIEPTEREVDFSDHLPGDLPEGTTIDEWGVARRPGSSYHFTRMIHPLADADEDDLEQYPFPDRDAAYRLQRLAGKAEELHGRGYFVDGFVGHIFETAWYMRGMERLMMDFHQHESFACRLLDRITELNCAVAAAMADAGFDMVRFGDDVGTQRGMMISPETWRRYLKPRLAREVQAAREVKPDIHIWYHSDGDISEIIPGLIEAGVDVLNPVQPECLDPAWVKKNYGDRLTLWGTIGTQSVMPFGSPEEVRETVRRNIEELGRDGGLVLAPTHVLEPDVPWENIEAFVEACEG